MKILIIKPNPYLTNEETKLLAKDLGDSIRAGVIFADPDAITYEIVEFDSIEYDTQSLYPKLPERNEKEDLNKFRELMNSRINRKEKNNDSSRDDEENS